MAWVQSSRFVLLSLAVSAAACGTKKPTPASTAPPAAGLPALSESERQAAAAASPHDHGPGGAANPHGAMGAGANPHGAIGAGANPHGAMPPGGSAHGGLPPAPLGEPTTPGGIPFDEKSVIVGSFAVPDAVKPKIQAGDTIFLTVRRATDDGQPGPILAVKKLEAAKTFPQPFSVDGRDAMMAGTALSGKVVVNVRVDKDGNATSKNPGDVVGTSAVLEPPAKQVIIQLDKVL